MPLDTSDFTEPQMIRHCLYREWFPNRNNPTQRSLESNGRIRESLSQRFKEMHGMTLEQYHRQCAALAEKQQS